MLKIMQVVLFFYVSLIYAVIKRFWKIIKRIYKKVIINYILKVIDNV